MEAYKLEEDKKLKSVLSTNNKEICPVCRKEIDRGDVAWNTGSTEFGTGYSVLVIICECCFTEIFHGTTWYEIESFDEFIDELESIISSNSL
jgi:hypothetical protein